MNLQTLGGVASLTCAATYLFGFLILVTVLAPLGYGSDNIDAHAVVTFILGDPGFLILWNSVIYILNALALVVLVVAIRARLRRNTPDWATVAGALGLVWATLVLAAGMIGNVAVERASLLAHTDMARAVALWETLHAVELGLGGGNEVAGGIWIGCVSIAGLIGRGIGKVTAGIGLLTGAGGMLTLIPAIGDAAGAVFGLGAIAWFVAIGYSLAVKGNTVPSQAPTTAS